MPDDVNPNSQRTFGSLDQDGSAATTNFQLTPKEELAVIIQRLKSHEENATDLKCKLRLEFAADLIRHAIFWR